MFFTKKYKKLTKHNNDLLQENNLILRNLIEHQNLKACSTKKIDTDKQHLIENDNYLTQYKILHQENQSFGTSSIFLKEPIVKYITQYEAKEILDYGCGKGLLSDELEKELPVTCDKYDPCVAEFSKLKNNKYYDFIINTDVLEHIPLNDLDNILKHISSLGKRCFFNISCRLAVSLLPNGENAHCTIYPPRWWNKKLLEHFTHVQEVECDDLTAVSFLTDNESD